MMASWCFLMMVYGLIVAFNSFWSVWMLAQTTGKVMFLTCRAGQFDLRHSG